MKGDCGCRLRVVFWVARVAILGVITGPGLAHAVPIEPTFEFAYQWVGTTGKTRAIPEEVTYVAIDAGVTPSPNTPVAGVTTTVTALHPSFGTIELDFWGPGSGLGGFPNEYLAFTDLDPNRTEPWTITATTSDISGTSSVSVVTPVLNPAALLPTATDVTITGNGLAPTISWTIPGAAVISGGRLDILRITSTDPFEQTLVFAQNLDATTTTFSLPLDFGDAAIDPSETSLIDGAHYQARVTMTGPRESTFGYPESWSYSHFEFKAHDGDMGDTGIYLPSVTLDAMGDPIYHFDIAVETGETYYVDPDVAVGYDFRIGAGDPGFASVLLPDFGDGLYDLFLFDALGIEFDTGFDLVAGEVFSFLSDSFMASILTEFGLAIDSAMGLAAFGIRGIEASAMIDPDDVLGFVTGLTFVADGRFTGTQTPIIASVEVPEPDALLLMGLLGLLALRWRGPTPHGDCR